MYALRGTSGCYCKVYHSVFTITTSNLRTARTSAQLFKSQLRNLQQQQESCNLNLLQPISLHYSFNCADNIANQATANTLAAEIRSTFYIGFIIDIKLEIKLLSQFPQLLSAVRMTDNRTLLHLIFYLVHDLNETTIACTDRVNRFRF